MKIEIGKTAWTSSRLGVILVVIVEIESEKQQQVRVRDKAGAMLTRDTQDLHDTESSALRARLDHDRFWGQKYRDMAWRCEENESRIRQRLLNIEARRKLGVA